MAYSNQNPPSPDSLACESKSFFFLLENWTRDRILLIALILVLLLEAVFTAWYFSSFFGGDSIFFFARRLTHSSEILQAFSSLDDRSNYRPFTLVFFSFLLYPLFNLNHVGYHLVPLIFHAANTILAFKLLRKFLNSNLAIIAATIYFGLSSVNFFVTYSITFMPDFIYAFFYLISILAYLRFDESRKARWLVISLAAFLLALCSKEAAVTLLPVLALCLAGRSIQRSRQGFPSDWEKSLVALAPYLLILGLYLAYFMSMKAGVLYTRNPEDPFRTTFSASTLPGNVRYLWWALNLPVGASELRRYLEATRILNRAPMAGGGITDIFMSPTSIARLLLMLPLAAVLLVGVKSSWRREPAIRGGLLWFVITLSPVFFLSMRTMRHNLYVPLIGFAAVMGVALEEVYRRAQKRYPHAARAGLACLLTAFMVANAFAVKNHLDRSWPRMASQVAQRSLNDLKEAHPALPDHATLYFLDNRSDDLFFYYERGNLFRVMYRDRTLRTLFEQRGDVLPPDYLSNPRLFVLYYYGTHLYDVTEGYRADAADTASYKLLDHFPPVAAQFDENKPHLPADSGTPKTSAPFLYRFAAGDQCRKALVTAGGASVSFLVPTIPPHARLVFGIALLPHSGSGAVGRVWLESEGKRDLLFQSSRNPVDKPEDGQWLDKELDLSRFAGKSVKLSFECSSDESHGTVSGWLGWSVLRIQTGDHLARDIDPEPPPN